MSYRIVVRSQEDPIGVPLENNGLPFIVPKWKDAIQLARDITVEMSTHHNSKMIYIYHPEEINE